MNKILLVDDEAEILEILETLITSEINCEIVKSASGNKAIAELKKDQEFDLILSDYNMADGNGADLFNFNVKNKNLPFVFISGGYLEDYDDVENFYEANDLNYYIHKPVNFEELTQRIEMVLGSSAHQMINEKSLDEAKTQNEYSSLSYNFIKNFDLTNYEIYLKLNELKYVRVKNLGDSSKEELERYDNKVNNIFYMKREDFCNFLNMAMSKHINDIVESPAKVSTIDILGNSLELMHESLNHLGMTQGQIELVNQSVSKSLDILLGEPELKSKIEIFLKSKGYFVSHSLTAAHLCYLISTKLELADENTLRKFTMASILHDITLADSQLCQVYDINSDLFESLTKEQKTKVLNHAGECSETLESLDSIPIDVVTLVKEHHEWPNSAGFPLHKSKTTLFKLSNVFIASLHLADHLFHRGSSVDSLYEFLSHLREVGFDEKESKSVYNALKEIVKQAA